MADNEINVVITASDKASNIIAGISKSMKMLVGSVSDIASEYVAYGDEVKKLSTFTGMQSDETSRLIQLADDAFVEFDTLRMSAKYMSDNGIAPNIDNLAKLSDQFLAIKDPLAQSQFLVDNFSRAGIDMGNIMALSGDKIREMGASINDNLIMTPEKLEGINAGKIALDNFNDSIAGMKYEVAGRLLDIFEKMPKPIKDTALAIGAMTSSGMLDGLTNMFIILGNIGGLKTGLVGISTALKGIAVSTWAAVGPFVAVAAAVVAVGIAIWKLIGFVTYLFDLFKKAAQMGVLWEFITALTPWNIAKNVVSTATGRAGGGLVSAGVPYIVGEQGPELYVPASNGSIIPNDTLRSSSGGRGGSNTFILQYSPMISLADRFEVETKLGPIIRNAMRSA